ncbi:hypothetical protein LJK87_36135 [Paenibacillus sp. P25]|nr:hypothetical protein LJK87_36135 [Paenibacillus sp. P25]
MDWEQIRQRLESIWGSKVTLNRRSWEEWSRLAAEGSTGSGTQPVRSVEHDGGVDFFARKEGAEAWVLTVASVNLSPSERRLVELMLESGRAPEKRAAGAVSEEERKAGLARDWLRQQQRSLALRTRRCRIPWYRSFHCIRPKFRCCSTGIIPPRGACSTAS